MTMRMEHRTGLICLLLLVGGLTVACGPGREAQPPRSAPSGHQAEPPQTAPMADQEESPQTVPTERIRAGETVLRGEALSDAPLVPIADLLKEPEIYLEKTVTIQGRAQKVCEKKGCWMEVAPGPGEAGLRVTFKDYGFFVPLDSAGMKVKAEGRVAIHELSREHVEHLVAEGAKVRRAPDGTATEVGFVATGVELGG